MGSSADDGLNECRSMRRRRAAQTRVRTVETTIHHQHRRGQAHSRGNFAPGHIMTSLLTLHTLAAHLRRPVSCIHTHVCMQCARVLRFLSCMMVKVAHTEHPPPENKRKVTVNAMPCRAWHGKRTRKMTLEKERCHRYSRCTCRPTTTPAPPPNAHRHRSIF